MKVIVVVSLSVAVPVLLETYGIKEISDPTEAFEAQLRNYDPFLVRISDNVTQQEALLAELLVRLFLPSFPSLC